MSDSTRQPIAHSDGLDRRSEIDSAIAEESIGMSHNTVHGIPPFTMPRADGTLEAIPDIPPSRDGTATSRMMRRRPGDTHKGDQDGDGSHTNSQGYRDGQDQNKDGKHGRAASGHGGISEAYKSGATSRRPFLQRLHRAGMPTLIGGFIAWYFDAVDVLVYRSDPRIKGNLLTFSLLCLLTMLSIFFYLEFLRPRLLKKPTEYVNWEKELLYPVRIATTSLVVGSIGASIALWPVWHFLTFLVLTAVAVATINVLGIFF